MSTMLDSNEVRMKISPRKFRDVRHPATKGTVTVPMTTAGKSVEIHTRTREVTPTAVELARASGEADSHAVLLKLRELVVGPAQQLNEARLEELMNIFEERESELRGAMRDMQKRNSELEVALKQSCLDQLNAFKAEFQSLTDAMSIDAKKAVTSIRDDITAVRKEALSLVEDGKAVLEQKIEVQAARTKSLVDSETGKLRVDLKSMGNTLATAVENGQREAQLNISRVLKDASENLARATSAG